MGACPGGADPSQEATSDRGAGPAGHGMCPPLRRQPPASCTETPTSCTAAGWASSSLLCASRASEASSWVEHTEGGGWGEAHAEGAGAGGRAFPLQPHRFCARDLQTKAKATEGQGG